MSSSPWEGFVRTQPTHGATGGPVAVGTGAVLGNNLLHTADEDAMVRVASSNLCMSPDTPGATDTWYAIGLFGPFDGRLDEDGLAYPLRVRLGGRSSQGNSVTLRAVVSSRWTAESELIHEEDAAGNPLEHFCDITTSSTTRQWVAGSTTLLRLNDLQTRDALSRGSFTYDALGGDPVGVEMLSLVCTVWGSTTNLTSAPELNGIYLAEFCGL